MNHRHKAVGSRFLLLPALLLLCESCARVAPFSDAAQREAVSLKEESLGVMNRATEPFDTHRPEVSRLRARLEGDCTSARSRSGNDLSARQWAILADPDGALLGGFLARWERQGGLSPAFIEESTEIVSDAFDEIVALESAKRKQKGGKP